MWKQTKLTLVFLFFFFEKCKPYNVSLISLSDLFWEQSGETELTLPKLSLHLFPNLYTHPLLMLLPSSYFSYHRHCPLLFLLFFFPFSPSSVVCSCIVRSCSICSAWRRTLCLAPNGQIVACKDPLLSLDSWVGAPNARSAAPVWTEPYCYWSKGQKSITWWHDLYWT